ncbi:eosinophil peroxidase-like, partial [Ruditapes philippinarum]|uniref:eosinophil peroxidase-like n=1 Tax=Ruditapes philippinarum TaxID=129788 RepID=UPI00295ADAE6
MDTPSPYKRAQSYLFTVRQHRKGTTITLFYFMQFIDHDLAKTQEGHVRNRKECCKKPDKTRKYCLPVTFEDPDEKFFAQDYCVEGRRSFTLFQCDNSEVDNQINEITSFLDASMVYGSSQEEEHTLRTFIG